MKYWIAGTAAALGLLLPGCGQPNDTGELLEQAARRLTGGKYAQALESAEKAVQKSPERYDALLMRAVAQERLGQKDKALASVLAAEKLAPASFAVQYTLGRLYASDRDKQPAAQLALSKALALKPGDPGTLILLTNLYMSLRPFYALQLLNQLGQSPKLAAGAVYRNELGVSQILSGRSNEGGTNLNLAMSGSPRNPIYVLNYARYLDCYARQPMAALPYYQTYLGLAQNSAGHAAYRQWVTERCRRIRQR